MKKILLTLLLVAPFLAGFAAIRLPDIFSDGMVLQQKSSVPIWGWAEAGHKVTLQTSWNKKKYTTSAASNGAWKIQVPTPAAGGPYSIRISDEETIELQDVLIGEVWLCSGQSNMEMPMMGFPKQAITRSAEFIESSTNPNIRLFRVPRAAQVSPQDTLSAKWQQANPASVKPFSAVGYLYARLLQEKLQVPVGIIASSYGGTPIEAWMPKESLQEFPSVKLPSMTNPPAQLKNQPTVLYNAMIHPVAGYGIRGFLWYQGEANARNPHMYAQLMAAMVKEWRARWHSENLPFYYVQIAPFYKKDSTNASTRVREAQLKALSLVPASAMAVTLDAGDENNIHPSDKLTVAQRLYQIALAKTYGVKNTAWSGPVYKSMKVAKDTVYLRFDQATSGLTDKGKGLHQFEVAGADRVFYPAEAGITPMGVSVYSPQVKHPVAVRYGFKDWVSGDLYNKEGLPASSFRTDDW